MDTNNLRQFITSITQTILEAGELAIEFQGKVVNIGKNIPLNESDTERVKQRDGAKTEIDGKVLWPAALLKCISGEYTASIFHSPQIRDVLLGAIIESLPGGYMVDWAGKKIIGRMEAEFPV